MPSSILAEMTVEDLLDERRELDEEIERRRWAGVSALPAVLAAGPDELELMERLWYLHYQGELASDEEGRTALSWLWSCTVVSYQSQFDRQPLTGYVAERVCESIAALIFIDESGPELELPGADEEVI